MGKKIKNLIKAILSMLASLIAGCLVGYIGVYFIKNGNYDTVMYITGAIVVTAVLFLTYHLYIAFNDYEKEP